VLDKLKELLIVLPAAHLFLCFSYLFFYYSSFGYSVWIFASPADVFSVSFSDVAPAYVSITLGIALAVALRPRPKDPPPTEDEATRKKFRLFLWVFGAAIGLLIIWCLVLTVLYYSKNGFVLYIAVHTAIAVSLMVASAVWGPRLISHPLGLDLALYAALVILLVAVRGLEDGQRDRALAYKDVKDVFPRCKNTLVARPLGASYLAILPNNARVILGADCSVQFVLFDAARFREFPKGAPGAIAFGRQ
jgi:hypothetical protein